METRCCWYCLANVKDQPLYVRNCIAGVSHDDLVSQLQAKIAAKFHGTWMDKKDASGLCVYSNMATYLQRDNLDPLRADTPIGAIGKSQADPVVVVVPTYYSRRCWFTLVNVYGEVLIQLASVQMNEYDVMYLLQERVKLAAPKIPQDVAPFELRVYATMAAFKEQAENPAIDGDTLIGRAAMTEDDALIVVVPLVNRECNFTLVNVYGNVLVERGCVQIKDDDDIYQLQKKVRLNKREILQDVAPYELRVYATMAAFKEQAENPAIAGDTLIGRAAMTKDDAFVIVIPRRRFEHSQMTTAKIKALLNGIGITIVNVDAAPAATSLAQIEPFTWPSVRPRDDEQAFEQREAYHEYVDTHLETALDKNLLYLKLTEREDAELASGIPGMNVELTGGPDLLILHLAAKYSRLFWSYFKPRMFIDITQDLQEDDFSQAVSKLIAMDFKCSPNLVAGVVTNLTDTWRLLWVGDRDRASGKATIKTVTLTTPEAAFQAIAELLSAPEPTKPMQDDVDLSAVGVRVKRRKLCHTAERIKNYINHEGDQA